MVFKMKCTTLFLVLTKALVLISNVAGLESEKIVGGRLAKKNEIKYQVSIQRMRSHFCGGTLIAPDVVLTAAHCFYNKENMEYKDEPYFAIAGAISKDDITYRKRVKTIYLHNGYGKDKQTGNSLNDIALLRLEEGFAVGKDLPIDLASLPNKYDDFVGKTAIVAGFGYDNVKVFGNERIGSSSGKLKQEYVDILDPKKCFLESFPTLICGQMHQTLGSPQSVCSGDSGGPLVFDNKVIGIVSTSLAVCDESIWPAAYTKVSEYLDFINSVLIDTPTSDMSIQFNRYVTLDVPLYNKKVITNSPKIMQVVEYMKILLSKIQAREDRQKVLERSVNDLKKKLKNLEGTAEYKARFQEYLAQFNESITNNKELDQLGILIHLERDHYSKLWKSEKVYEK